MKRIAALLVFGALFVPAFASAQNTSPSIAVFNFSTQGLTSNQWGQFEPGVALSDLVTDQLVSAGKFNVMDRKTLDNTLSEHQLSASGEVSPESAITAGHLIGARYLVTGNVLQLDQTGGSAASAGSWLPSYVGAVAGGVNTHRVTIKVAVRVVDAKTGQIVQSFTDEETRSGTSWNAGGFGGGAAGGYSNSQFVNSDMGHLINDEAAKIASTIDPSKFVATAAPPTLRGQIAALDSGNVIVNIGSSKGVQSGMIFDVVKTKSMVDPTTHEVLTVDEKIGKIQIDSVNANASVAHIVSGKATVRANVVSEGP